jgi:formylmethanofuran dehydrogenase subunit C
VTDAITLTLRSPLTEILEADSIVPDRFATSSEADIAALPVWCGRQRLALGDVFDARGAHSARVRIVGDVRLVADLGAGMTGGELVIDGNAGARVGAGMSGGRIEVIGSAGDDPGAAMRGGSIIIRGSAGDRVGAASPGAARGMSGGEIVVAGSVGDDAGSRMRRGLLFIGGSAGAGAARAIIAGTVIVLGRVGTDPAAGNKRGTLVAAHTVDVPVTYQYACTYEPPHVRLMLTHVRRRYAVDVESAIVNGRYRRYCGDAGTVARGEILEWIPE